MKILLCLLLSLPSITSNWLLDFDKARRTAQEEHKYILLNFSGSDWCAPCIQMDKQIFNSETFEDFASKNLVLLKADFPRLRKNALEKDQQEKNDKLAESFNKKGIFPLTVLLDAEGRVVRTWEGLPHLSPSEFVSQVEMIIHARK